MERDIETIRFEADGYELLGHLHRPQGKARGVVVGSHGLFSNGDSAKQIALAKVCVKAKIAFFRFSHRGCPPSQGRFERVTSLKGRARDLAAAVERMKQRPGLGENIALFGSSMGGATVLAYATQADQPFSALITVAAPLRMATSTEAIRAMDGSDPAQSRKLADSGKRLCFDLSEPVSRLRRILIFHGENDQTIPLSQGLDLYERVGEPKKLIVQEDGDHEISHPEHQREFIQESLAWYQRWL